MNTQRRQQSLPFFRTASRMRALLSVLAILLVSQSGVVPFCAMIVQAAPTENMPVLPAYQVGVYCALPPGTTAEGRYSFTGLPYGLSGNMRTGGISGVPLVSGLFTVSVTVRDPLTNQVLERRSFPLMIAPLYPSLLGQFYGFIMDEGDVCRGNVTLTVGKTGVTTAKVALMEGTLTLTSKFWTREGDILATILENRDHTAKLFLSAGMEGSFKGYFSIGEEKYMLIIGRPDPSAAGYYTVALSSGKLRLPPDVEAMDVIESEYPLNMPWGNGFLAVAVDANGLAHFFGRLSDGTFVTGSSAVLFKYGIMSVFLPLYGRRGYFSMLLEVDSFMGTVSDVDESVPQWYYPGDPAHPYHLPFLVGPHSKGARYEGYFLRHIQLGVQTMDYDSLFLNTQVKYNYGIFYEISSGNFTYQPTTGIFTGRLPAYLVGARSSPTFYGVIITSPFDDGVFGQGYYLGVAPEDPLRILQSRRIVWSLSDE